MSALPDLHVHIRDVGGVITRYYEAGSGPPLMLVHGAGVPAEIWLSNIQILGQHFHVCAPDTLGSGLTGVGDYKEGPIHPHVVSHLFALADALGFERFAVVGSSLGGLFATLMALEAPERVSQLVVVGSGSVFSDETQYRATWAAVSGNGATAYAKPTLEVCRTRMSRLVRCMDKVSDTLLLMQMSCYALPEAAQRFARRTEGMLHPLSLTRYRPVDRLEQIRPPCLVIVGREDPRVDLNQVERELERIPDARLEVFEDCGHYPQLENAHSFNTLLSTFLRDDRSGSEPARHV